MVDRDTALETSPLRNAPLRKALGDRLREQRSKAGISSQEALAHRAGAHRTYIGRLERGESGATVEALAAILAALDVSLGEFFRSGTS